MMPRRVGARILAAMATAERSAETEQRAALHGPSRLAAGGAEPRWHAFLRQYRDPMQIVLTVAGVGSLYPLEQLGTGLTLLLLTVFNAGLGLQQAGEGGGEPPLLSKLTERILLIAGAAVAVSIAFDLSRGDSFTAVLTGAIAFAVAGIPTGLPAAVTAILAHGTQALARAHAVLRRPRSAVTLGSTSAINVDTTGTLTIDQMTAVEMTISGRRYAVSGTGYSADEGRIKHVAGQSEVPLEPFLLPLALASDAVVDEDGELVGDPTDGALVVLAEKGGLDVVATRERYPRVAELPFDAAYGLTATFHAFDDEAGRRVIRAFVTGAPDRLLARAAQTLDAGLNPIPVDGALQERHRAESERLAREGLRVIATARKDFPRDEFDAGADPLALLDGLTLLTLVGIVDPPRPQAKAAIATARAAGIRVRVVTGGDAVTAAAVADKLGIEGRAIAGAELAAMSREEALGAIDGIGVIGRATPEHKVRLVETLRGRGHVVAATGDGLDDIPALEQADIGIATGGSVEDAAAMVVTDGDLATVVRAVELGRGVLDKLEACVRFQLVGLAGLIATFLGASILDVVGGVPLLPLQTLWFSFTTGVLQSVGVGLLGHRPLLDRATTTWVVTVGLVLGATTLGVIAWADHAHGIDVARTMGLTTFSLGAVCYALTVRGTFGGVSLVPILFGTQLGLLNRMLGTVGLDLHEWLICIVSALTVVVASEIRKLLIRRREARATT
jgi:Ca2+-transporting ATPase